MKKFSIEVPLLAFFVILSIVWYIHNKNKVLKYLFLLLICISFVINAQAAFLYTLVWDKPVWTVYDIITTKFDRIMEIIRQTF